MKAIKFVLGWTICCVILANANATVLVKESTKVVVSPKSTEVVVRMRHVHHEPTTVTFALPAGATIHIGTNTTAALTDLTVGQVAHVRYTIENGNWLAHEIVVNPVHGAHLPKTTNGELAAHGAIVSYNPSAGLLTIKHSR